MSEKNKSHSEPAMKLFKNECNCSQAVFGAFCDETGMDFETAMKLSSSFGGGMGRLREVCGAVTGMFMVAGIKYGYSDSTDKQSKDDHYQLIQTLADSFKKECGSIICRELLGLPGGADNPISEVRTDQYYQNRPCEQYVGIAARIMDEVIENSNIAGENIECRSDDGAF